MLKYLAACLCVLTSVPAMAEGLDETEITTTEINSTEIAADPNYQSLHYFTGDWRCIDSGEVGLNSGNLMVLHVYGTLKHWYTFEAITFGAAKTESTSYMSYSPNKGAFVEFGLSDFGGYSRGKAPGWANHTLTFTGYTHLLDQTGYHWRKLITAVDATHFNYTWETSADGQIFTIKRQSICSK